MHAILITFESTVNFEELRLPSGAPLRLSDYIATLREWPGFISKTWMHDGATSGGYYLFADREAADAYLTELFSPLAGANSTMKNVTVRHFTVQEDMSKLTFGLPAVPSGV